MLEQLDAAAPFARVRADRQAEWLAALGIDDLVAEGRRIWEAGAARGDLEALAGRSRVTEAAALDRPRRSRRAPTSSSTASAAPGERGVLPVVRD